MELATAADAGRLTALINRAYEVEAFFKVGDRTDEEEVRQLLTDHQFLVIRNGGTIAGCVLVELRDVDGYFGMLSVDPAHQGAGVGARLVAEAEHFCSERGRRTMSLVVVNLREELPPWYAKLGYSVSGTEPWPEYARDRVSRPCHFIIMTKPIGVRTPTLEPRR